MKCSLVCLEGLGKDGELLEDVTYLQKDMRNFFILNHSTQALQ